MRSTTIMGLLIIGLVILALALDIGSRPSQTRSEYAIGTAWSMTPATQSPDEAYGEGFNDGYLAACRERGLVC